MVTFTQIYFSYRCGYVCKQELCLLYLYSHSNLNNISEKNKYKLAVDHINDPQYGKIDQSYEM